MEFVKNKKTQIDIMKFILFSRIGELIFTTPVVALSNPSIFPQVPYGIDVRALERSDYFVVNVPD